MLGVFVTASYCQIPESNTTTGGGGTPNATNNGTSNDGSSGSFEGNSSSSEVNDPFEAYFDVIFGNSSSPQENSSSYEEIGYPWLSIFPWW